MLSFQSCLHRILKYEVFLLLLFVSLVLFHKVHNAWSVFSSPYSSPFSLILHRFFWYFLSARSFWSSPFPVFLEYLTDGSRFLLYLSRLAHKGMCSFMFSFPDEASSIIHFQCILQHTWQAGGLCWYHTYWSLWSARSHRSRSYLLFPCPDYDISLRYVQPNEGCVPLTNFSHSCLPGGLGSDNDVLPLVIKVVKTLAKEKHPSKPFYHTMILCLEKCFSISILKFLPILS